MEPKMTTEHPLPNLERWRPAAALWLELAERQPHLAISPTVAAWYGFFRRHRETLADAGVVIRLTSRNWLADPTRFAAAIQAIKCGVPIPRLGPLKPRMAEIASCSTRQEGGRAT
jgi:hypothetical protein